MSYSHLLTPFDLKGIELKNRVVMAPMTRCRATSDHIPTPIMADYYAARADAGLLITEGTAPSPDGIGYARIPGIYSQEQMDAWRAVPAAVHERGGRIFMQLMHTGRVSHPLNMPAGSRIVSASAVALTGTMWTDASGMQPFPVPRAMTEDDIENAIASYANAAANAIEAGFDGVELHAANGYLIDQFLNTASNRRTDQWGGSPENRIRFAVEVARRVVDRIGAARVGMRISPYGVFNDMAPDDAMDQVYEKLADALNKIGIAYIHVNDQGAAGSPVVKPVLRKYIRNRFGGAYIVAGGYDAGRADREIAEDLCDLAAFGRPYISNPDLVDRIRFGIALAQPDPTTFYASGEKGYSDYATAAKEA